MTTRRFRGESLAGYRIDYSVAAEVKNAALKKKLKVSKPAKLHLTFAPTMRKPDEGLYSNFKGTNRELAKILAHGAGRRNGIPRPIMKIAKEKLSGKSRKWLSAVVKNNIKGKAAKGFFDVDWHAVGDELEKWLYSEITENKLGLAPIQPITVERKEWAGHEENADTPAFATGQLAEAIYHYIA